MVGMEVMGVLEWVLLWGLCSGDGGGGGVSFVMGIVWWGWWWRCWRELCSWGCVLGMVVVEWVYCYGGCIVGMVVVVWYLLWGYVMVMVMVLGGVCFVMGVVWW